MAQEAGVGQRLVRLHALQFVAAAEHLDLRGTVLERGGRVVERGGRGANHGDALTAQALEIDWLGRVRAQRSRQFGDRPRHPPVAAGMDALREHELAREADLARAVRLELDAQEAVARARDRCHADEAHPVAHRQLQHATEPAEVGLPHLLRDVLDRGERAGAVLRLHPRLEREAGHAEVGATDVLGRAQRLHAREAHPDAFLAVGRLVDHFDIDDALAQQQGRDGEAALAPSDHEHVQHRLAIVCAGRHPGLVRVGDQAQVACDVDLEFGKRGGDHGGNRGRGGRNQSAKDSRVASKAASRPVPGGGAKSAAKRCHDSSPLSRVPPRSTGAASMASDRGPTW